MFVCGVYVYAVCVHAPMQGCAHVHVPRMLRWESPLPLHVLWGSSSGPLGSTASALYSLICAVGFDNFSFLKDPMTKKVKKPWSAAAQDSSIIELTGNVSETLELQGFMGLRPQKPSLGIWLAFMATGGSVHPVQPPLLRVQTGDHLLRVLLVQQKKSSVKRRKMKRSKEIPQ